MPASRNLTMEQDIQSDRRTYDRNHHPSLTGALWRARKAAGRSRLTLSLGVPLSERRLRAAPARATAARSVMLPFQGQQIWSAQFVGRELTMKSMFDEPRATPDYLEHLRRLPAPLRRSRPWACPPPRTRTRCTASCPTPPTSRRAWWPARTSRAPTSAWAAQYQHTVAFNDNYVAQPLVKLLRRLVAARRLHDHRPTSSAPRWS